MLTSEDRQVLERFNAAAPRNRELVAALATMFAVIAGGLACLGYTPAEIGHVLVGKLEARLESGSLEAADSATLRQVIVIVAAESIAHVVAPPAPAA